MKTQKNNKKRNNADAGLNTPVDSTQGKANKKSKKNNQSNEME